jgi:hypothetical protein
MYGPGTEIHAVLKSGTTATLTSALVNVHCTSSTVQGSTSNTGTTGSPVEGTITALSFSGCKTTSGTACTVTTIGINTTTEMPIAQVTATGGGNGLMTVTPDTGDENPGAHVTCGFFINCTFQVSDIELDIDGGNPALSTAIAEPLEREGGICPEEAFWDATYEVTTPKPLFVVHP